MIWIIVFGFVIAALLVTLGYVIGSGMQYEKARDALESAKVEREAKNLAITQRDVAIEQRNEARSQRDRLNMECATMRMQLEEIIPRYEQMERQNAELQSALARYEQQYATKRRRTRPGQAANSNDVPSHTPPVGGAAQLERIIEPQ